jgi:hypothetical protein
MTYSSCILNLLSFGIGTEDHYLLSFEDLSVQVITLPKCKSLQRGIGIPRRLAVTSTFWKYLSIAPPEGWGYAFR